MYVKSRAEAIAQAKANANLTDSPWMVFADTSGNVRVERYHSDQDNIITIVQPTEKSEG